MQPCRDRRISTFRRECADVRVDARSNPARWIATSATAPAAEVLRLYCFPFAGGGASVFRPWLAPAGSEAQICAIQYPGREFRWNDAPFETLGELVDAIATDLDPLWHGNFAFWGHSFGALVAFEVTRRLIRRKRPRPRLLFVSGARAPQLPPRERIHHLPDHEFLARLTRFGGMAPEVTGNQELLNIVLPIVKHDFRLFEEYCFDDERPIDVAISAHGGVQDESVSISDVLAWSSVTSKTFRSRFFDGDHFFPFRAVGETWRYMRDDLQASPSTDAADLRAIERGAPAESSNE